MLFLSSFDGDVEARFDGYAWVGSDLIVGQSGADAYRAKFGSHIPHGHDGCYTTVLPTEDGWNIGTDSRGLARLYLFRDGKNWAISSSFYVLVTKLRQLDFKLQHIPGVLGALGVPRGFNDQIATSHTPIRDIELLPSFSSVYISATGLSIDSRPVEELGEYDEALAYYLSVWSSRLATLLEDKNVSLQADLSGGIDSRTVMAFLLNSSSFMSGTSGATVVSAWKKTRDFEVAQDIAREYGVPLERQRNRDTSTISQRRALASWHEDSLGVYLPLYLHGSSFNFAAVHAHGAGGGNFRPYYSGERVLSQGIKAKPYLPEEQFEEWLALLEQSSERLQALRPDTPPLILHYREFRNRFHFGHRPHHSLVFSPLESILTDAITDRDDRRDGRQVYFDIKASLSPKLMHLPFDQLAKSPSPENLRDLTVVEVNDVRGGSVFGGASPQSVREESFDPYFKWIDDGALALERDVVRAAIGEKATGKARQAVAQARERGVRLQAHDQNLMALSFARTADFVIDYWC